MISVTIRHALKRRHPSVGIKSQGVNSRLQDKHEPDVCWEVEAWQLKEEGDCAGGESNAKRRLKPGFVSDWSTGPCLE